MEKIVGWGAGGAFRKHYTKEYEIEYTVDSNPLLHGKEISNVIVKSPNELIYENGKVIIVLFSTYEKEIIEDLAEIGVKEYELIRSEDYLVKKQSYNKIAYALFHEDAILSSIIDYYNKNKIEHYIDVGANHPVNGNATYLFYLKGASGCLIEPNIEYEKILKSFRSRDELLICGCGSEEEDGTSIIYYKVENFDTRNTFSAEVAKEYSKNGYEISEQKILIFSLNHIIHKYGKKIDYISLDTEGLENKILNDFDFAEFDVQYFNIEKTEKCVYELMLHNGYTLLAQTASNWIFEREKSVEA